MADKKELIHKIIFIVKAHHSVIEKNTKDIGMHRSMHMILRYLAECKEPPSQKQIAERFKISAAAVAATLCRLENEGYIKKISCDQDRRSNIISITKKGTETLARTEQIFLKVDSDVFDGLCESKLDDLNRYLDVICKNLSAATCDADNNNGEKE